MEPVEPVELVELVEKVQMASLESYIWLLELILRPLQVTSI